MKKELKKIRKIKFDIKIKFLTIRGTNHLLTKKKKNRDKIKCLDKIQSCHLFFTLILYISILQSPDSLNYNKKNQKSN
jgi:hypothetical protein